MSYGDLAGANTYHAARGNSLWTGADTPKSQALLRAQDYIRFSYVQRFSTGYDSTSANVEAAVYEAAILELITPGFWSKTYTEAETKVLVGLDSLRWQVTGSVKNPFSFAPRSTKIEALLWPYMMLVTGVLVA